MSDIHKQDHATGGTVCCFVVAKSASPPVVWRLVCPWLRLRLVVYGTWSQLRKFGEVATRSGFKEVV